jgi:predicted permease
MREPFFSSRTPDEIHDDNRAELDAWIGERVDALVTLGLSPADARDRAVAEFGDLEAARRYAAQQDAAADRRIRVWLWSQELASDLRIAARMLARMPTVSAVVLLTFALGIGAATAVFSIIHAMLIRPLPYGREETLVQLQPVENGVVRPSARHSAAAVAALRERTTSFNGITAIDATDAPLMDYGDPEQVGISSFTPDAFDVLGVRPAIGRTFGTSEESSKVVILLDGPWRRRFGADPGIVGRTIMLASSPHEVIGVMPPAFRVPTYEAVEMLRPHSLASFLGNPRSAQFRAFRLFARLKPGVSIRAAQADVERVMQTLQKEFPQSFGGIGSRVVPIRTAVAGDAKPRLVMLMGAAIFVLLIACANVAGILLARALVRRQELSLRVALGAGRGRLVREFLVEGAVLSMLGVAAGLLMADGGIVALRQIAASVLPAGTTLALEPGVLLFAIACAIGAWLVSSVVPALAATREVGVVVGRDQGRASASRAARRMRLGLVAAQLAVSVVLLVGTGLFLRTLYSLSNLDVGYGTEHVLTFRPTFTHSLSEDAQDAFYASAYEQLHAIPGVLSVGGGNMPMTGQSWVVGLEIEGRAVERGRLPDVRYTPASDEYFDALGIPTVRGRTFRASDRKGAPPVAVISRSLAKQLWPTTDPIGARVKPDANRPWFMPTIVGIVGDVRSGSVGESIPSVYTSQRQDSWRSASAFAIRGDGDPAALAGAVREAMRRVDSTLVVGALTSVEDLRRATPAIAERRVQMQLLLVFAVVALVVSAIGVYAVSEYAIEARRREFGIRLALGASRSGVLWLALRDGAQAALFGALAGVPIAVVLASRVRDMIYVVRPFDPLTLAVVLGTLILVVFAASVVPARRATCVDPAATMRTD